MIDLVGHITEDNLIEIDEKSIIKADSVISGLVDESIRVVALSKKMLDDLENDRIITPLAVIDIRISSMLSFMSQVIIHLEESEIARRIATNPSERAELFELMDKIKKIYIQSQDMPERLQNE